MDASDWARYASSGARSSNPAGSASGVVMGASRLAEYSGIGQFIRGGDSVSLWLQNHTAIILLRFQGSRSALIGSTCAAAQGRHDRGEGDHRRAQMVSTTCLWATGARTFLAQPIGPEELLLLLARR